MISFIKKIYKAIDDRLQTFCKRLPGSLYSLIVRMHRMLTYIFMGIVNTAVDYIAFYLLFGLFRIPIEWSQGLAFVTAAAHGYLLNSNLTFTEGKGRTRGQMIQYVGLDVILTILSSWFMGWIEQFEVSVLLMKTGVTIVTGLFHYVVYKFVVFRIKKEDKL